MEYFINPGIVRITVIEVPIIEDTLYDGAVELGKNALFTELSSYSKSSIIRTSITVILAIPGLIKYSIYSSNSLIIGISILVIGVPRLSGFRLSGTFFGPSHPNN